MARRRFGLHRPRSSPCPRRADARRAGDRFSVGAAAFKGGAGTPQVIAYRSPGRSMPCSGSSGRNGP